MTRCRHAGCRRAPAYPDQAYCAEHAPKWMPEWRRRAIEDAEKHGRVAVKALS